MPNYFFLPVEVPPAGSQIMSLPWSNASKGIQTEWVRAEGLKWPERLYIMYCSPSAYFDLICLSLIYVFFSVHIGLLAVPWTFQVLSRLVVFALVSLPRMLFPKMSIWLTPRGRSVQMSVCLLIVVFLPWPPYPKLTLFSPLTFSVPYPACLPCL